jgi:hypothetical protein
VILQDLQAIEEVLCDDEITKEIDQRYNIEHMLNNCRDRAVELLQEIGICIDIPKIFLVPELPAPYHKRGYSAFTADRGDSEKYDIQPGIYFPIKSLRPFYSEFLLFHEMIHVILGQISPYLLGRGLEEGLAELVGAMYLSSRILGKDLTVNLFIYNRLSSEYPRFWELYMDATRMATLLHQRFGLEGIVELLNSGREVVKQVEECCLRMRFDQIDLPHGKADMELADIADYLSLAFNRSLVVSPLAKYLSRYVQAGCTAEQILQNARVDITAGLKALQELENDVLLASFSSEGSEPDHRVVVWSDCDRLAQGSIIRYDIPTRSSEK